MDTAKYSKFNSHVIDVLKVNVERTIFSKMTTCDICKIHHKIYFVVCIHKECLPDNKFFVTPEEDHPLDL